VGRGAKSDGGDEEVLDAEDDLEMEDSCRQPQVVDNDEDNLLRIIAL